MVEASHERSAPSATGTLAERPIAHLLVYARNKRLSGKFELRAPDGRHGTIELWRGRISGVHTTPPVAYFGAVAYELGMIDTATLDSTLLEVAKTKRLHGEVLLERGALDRKQVDEILAEQACRKVHHLFGLPKEATFAFYDGRASAEEPPLALDPIAPTWRGIREAPPKASVDEVVARYAKMTLRMVNEAPLGRAGLGADEAALCDALVATPMTIPQMRLVSGLPTARVDLLAYLLVITKCVEPVATSSSEPVPASVPGAAARASMPAIQRPPSMAGIPLQRPPSLTGIPIQQRPSMSAMQRPSTLPMPIPVSRTLTPPGTPVAPNVGSGELRRSMSFQVPSLGGMPAQRSSSAALRAQMTGTAPDAAPPQPVFGPSDLGSVGIADRVQRVERESAFEALGIPEGASIEAARAAYFRLAKLWHPDRLAADLAPFRGEVERIFTHMTTAHATLTDPEARKSYLATRARRSSRPAANRSRKEIIRDLEALVAKRDFVLVEEEARALTETNKDDADGQAFLAWGIAAGCEASEERLRTALGILDKAINQDRYCERAYFYRGMIHKRLGNAAGAFRDFARVVQIEPKHVDAQREIRIYEMRARKGSGEHKLDALLTKAKKK